MWAALFGLIMFWNGRVTRGVLRGILERMERNQGAMLKNQERAAKDHELMISALQKALERSRSKFMKK